MGSEVGAKGRSVTNTLQEKNERCYEIFYFDFFLTIGVYTMRSLHDRGFYLDTTQTHFVTSDSCHVQLNILSRYHFRSLDPRPWCQASPSFIQAIRGPPFVYTISRSPSLLTEATRIAWLRVLYSRYLPPRARVARSGTKARSGRR